MDAEQLLEKARTALANRMPADFILNREESLVCLGELRQTHTSDEAVLAAFLQMVSKAPQRFFAGGYDQTRALRSSAPDSSAGDQHMIGDNCLKSSAPLSVCRDNHMPAVIERFQTSIPLIPSSERAETLHASQLRPKMPLSRFAFFRRLFNRFRG
jgi:hypothetical protein